MHGDASGAAEQLAGLQGHDGDEIRLRDDLEQAQESRNLKGHLPDDFLFLHVAQDDFLRPARRRHIDV
ncbi:hypothetical protein D9M72_610680 [compost metagenome]